MNKLNEIVTNILGLPNDFSDFESLELDSTENWDSLGHITLISELEAIFDIELDTDEILSMKTYSEIVSVLKNKGVINDD